MQCVKKVLLVSAGDPKDKRTWSGIEFSIYHQLMRYYEVEILTVDVGWAKRIDQKRQKILTFGKQYTRYGLLNSYVSSKIVERRLNNGHYDVAFVFGSTNIAFLSTHTPVVYYTDATTHEMQHYYWE